MPENDKRIPSTDRLTISRRQLSNDPAYPRRRFAEIIFAAIVFSSAKRIDGSTLPSVMTKLRNRRPGRGFEEWDGGTPACGAIPSS